MKIALVKPPATYANWYRQPALGIAYICACHRAEGHNCEIFDGYFHSLSPDELVEHVTKYNPDIIGITAMTHEIQQAAAIASQLKERIAVPLVIGGCHVTALLERTLSEFPVFDYGIYGEGEETFIELVKHIEGATSPGIRNIPGLVFRENSDVVVNEARPFCTEEKLNSLPYPAIDHYYADNKEALAHPNSYYGSSDQLDSCIRNYLQGQGYICILKKFLQGFGSVFHCLAALHLQEGFRICHKKQTAPQKSGHLHPPSMGGSCVKSTLIKYYVNSIFKIQWLKGFFNVIL